jgi:cytosine permease
VAAEARLARLSSRLDKLYEFERAPVTPDKLQSGRYFAACFSGEHIAATEFVIGAMFVKYGVSARDLLIGLAIGDFLAVLSWAFLCTPIAVRTRLTLYWYLRRIAGPGLTVFYSILNGVLYCILAGAMIAVAASAVSLGVNTAASALGSGFHIEHPALQDLLPSSVGWVIVVLVVGAVVVSLAIMGFKRLSQFSAVCAPWMFLIFIAGALATLPRLGEIHSVSDLWRIAETRIWNGVPEAGQERLGFWQVMFFAWFCNLAMHIGLSDMALFRYARHWSYGFYSAFGMYVGHYISWICAGVMGAVVAGLNPGQMSIMAAGVAGPLAVVLAGWTTANPTMYRAGLALQIATPNWARWKVTLVAGLITTIMACFPVFFMKLLDFVAIYGLLLMPIGAIVVTEHWFFPRLGLPQHWAEKRGAMVNIPAVIAWSAVILLCFPFEQFTGGHVRSPMEMLGVHMYYRWLPGWFVVVVVYAGLCYAMVGERVTTEAVVAEPASDPPGAPAPSPERTASRRLSPLTWAAGGMAFVALVCCLVLPLRVFLAGTEEYEANLSSYKTWLLVATLVYFVSATYWVAGREKARVAG